MPLKMEPISTIHATIGTDPNGRVVKFFTNTCYKHMDKYVPMDFGNLRENVSIMSDSITYEVPYATYQYKGVREDGTHKVAHYTTGGTGPYWDKRMWSAESDRVLNEVQKYVDRIL